METTSYTNIVNRCAHGKAPDSKFLKTLLKRHGIEMLKEYGFALSKFLGPNMQGELKKFWLKPKAKDFINDLQTILPAKLTCYRGLKAIKHKSLTKDVIDQEGYYDYPEYTKEAHSLLSQLMLLKVDDMFTLTKGTNFLFQHWSLSKEKALEFVAKQDSVFYGILIQATIPRKKIIFSSNYMSAIVCLAEQMDKKDDMVSYLSSYEDEQEVSVIHDVPVKCKVIFNNKIE